MRTFLLLAQPIRSVTFYTRSLLLFAPQHHTNQGHNNFLCSKVCVEGLLRLGKSSPQRNHSHASQLVAKSN
jgi:hypothetical protein